MSDAMQEALTASVIGAVIGGLFTMWGGYWATKWAAKEQKKAADLEQEAKNKKARKILSILLDIINSDINSGYEEIMRRISNIIAIADSIIMESNNLDMITDYFAMTEYIKTLQKNPNVKEIFDTIRQRVALENLSNKYGLKS